MCRVYLDSATIHIVIWQTGNYSQHLSLPRRRTLPNRQIYNINEVTNSPVACRNMFIAYENVISRSSCNGSTLIPCAVAVDARDRWWYIDCFYLTRSFARPLLAEHTCILVLPEPCPGVGITKYPVLWLHLHRNDLYGMCVCFVSVSCRTGQIIQELRTGQDTRDRDKEDCCSRCNNIPLYRPGHCFIPSDAS